MFQSVPFKGLNISSAPKPAPTPWPSSVAHRRPHCSPQHPKAFIRTANQGGHAGSHSRSPPPGRRDRQYGVPIGGLRAFPRSPGEYFRFPRPLLWRLGTCGQRSELRGFPRGFRTSRNGFRRPRLSLSGGEPAVGDARPVS